LPKTALGFGLKHSPNLGAGQAKLIGYGLLVVETRERLPYPLNEGWVISGWHPAS
jgi:hypothetical protein